MSRFIYASGRNVPDYMRKGGATYRLLTDHLGSVRLVVDVRGGADDYQDFYCPSIEWDWGDGTVSGNSEDCDPYEAGKSVIRRRFSAEHVYRLPGTLTVAFRLKQQKTRVVGTANTILQVRAGSQN